MNDIRRIKLLEMGKCLLEIILHNLSYFCTSVRQRHQLLFIPHNFSFVQETALHSSFTLIKKLFSFSSVSAIRVVSSAYMHHKLYITNNRNTCRFFPLLFKKIRKTWKRALTFHSHLVELVM